MEQNIDAQQTNKSMSHSSPLHSNLDKELPFLITHYLSNFGYNVETDGGIGHNGDASSDKNELLKRIQSIGHELSDVFHKLGSFGTTIAHTRNDSFPLGGNIQQDGSVTVTTNANYMDLVHRHPRLPPNHLEMLIHSSVAASRASKDSSIKETDKRPPLSLLDSSKTATTSSELPVWTALQPPVLLLPPPNNEAKKPASTSGNRLSEETKTPSNESTTSSEQKSNNGIPVAVGYDRQIILSAANLSRNHINIKIQLQNIKMQEKTTMSSLNYQNQQLLSLETSQIDETEKNIIRLECERVMPQLGRKLSELKDEKKNLLIEYTKAFKRASKACKEAAVISNFHDPTVEGIEHSSYLPVPTNCSPYLLREDGSRKRRPTLFRSIMCTPYVGRAGMLRKPNTFGSRPSTAHCLAREALARRMCHSITINAHLFYPVYCLRFDKSGQYFVSGADDNMVKLFYLGGASPSKRKSGRGSLRYGGNAVRGAVLVCTLRGHTGVIADIDVSSDNALLATASEDGDCRIWGLKDGCPVAILRGHVGGANMVSWSSLTPYRLVTVAQDGLARIWDVRGAAIKRYARIGKRSDYLPNIVDDEPTETIDQNQSTAQNNPSTQANPSNNQNSENRTQNGVFIPQVPPLLVNASNAIETGDPQNQNADELSLIRNAVQNEAVIGIPPVGANELPNQNVNQNQHVVVPPLPPGADNELSLLLNAGQNPNANQNGDNNFGRFTANDTCDEGVYLLAKLQHGDVVQEDSSQQQEVAAATRARRKTVQVICLARCPLGGHFATGSDDGLGRVWADIDDERIEKLDDGQVVKSKISRPYPRDVIPSKDLTLAVLSGHLNAITDIQYSHAGDRILTASQKDGNVRIWSWGKEILPENGKTNNSPTRKGKDDQSKISLQNMSQILIVLSGSSSKSTPIQRKRGRGADSGSGTIICDVAVWSYDDSYVITSQSTLLKSGNVGLIQPGSNVIRVWNSRNGHCLVALSGAHESSCPILVPHPFLSSIVASAGADGKVQIWDLDSGKSFFSHKNTLTYGPLENEQKGKNAGYLDGSFSPDGISLVLTDDNGRITVIDSLQSQESLNNSKSSQDVIDMTSSSSSDGQNDEDRDLSINAPKWMREQYFANDYYELVYDRHGYAVERGSGMSPHMAPRAARCNHSGAPVPDDVNITYRFLCGPLPTLELDCILKRQQIRQNAFALRKLNSGSIKVLHGKGRKVSANGISDCATVFVGNRNTEVTPTKKKRANDYRPIGQVRQLSSNYRWSNAHEEALDASESSDDESYQEPQILEKNDSDALSVSSTEGHRLGRRAGRPSQSNEQTRSRAQPSTSRQQRAPAEQPTRASQRQAARRNVVDIDDYSDSDSSDNESFVQEGTLNTKPYRDKDDFYKLDHFYRVNANEAGLVQRAWVQRLQSADGYLGKKMYCPQVGDSVVYIPRAHYDLIQQFPTRNDSLHPWLHFPPDGNWPAVRCNVTSIRYRFPYMSYFRSTGTKCTSIVLILTLEVTGYQPVRNAPFPWPAPDFTPYRQTRSKSKIEFEVSVFDVGEADVAEFIIPEKLYLWRVKSLEKAIRTQNKKKKIELYVYYRQDDDKGQDLEFEQHKGIFAQYNSISDGQNHMQGSGYNSVILSWENLNIEPSTFCTWEIDAVESATEKPLPPSLTDNEKSSFLYIIEKITEDEEIKDWFDTAPDFSRYCDYDHMVEVPMYFSKIRERLHSSYYSNKLSVASDIRLIEINCYKYNPVDSDICIAATRMLTIFENYFLGTEFQIPTITPSTNNNDDIDDRAARRNGSILETFTSLKNVARRDAVYESHEESNVRLGSRHIVQQVEDYNGYDRFDSESDFSSCASDARMPLKEDSGSDIASDDDFFEVTNERTRNKRTNLRSPRIKTAVSTRRNKKSGDSDYSLDSDEDAPPKRSRPRSNASKRVPPSSKPRGRARKKTYESESENDYSPKLRGRARKKAYESENESENDYQIASDCSEEPSNVDYDGDDYVDDFVDNKPKPRGKKKGKKKRKAKTASAKKGRKRAKVDDESDQETTFYPSLPTWPRIDSQHIYALASNIIEEIEKLDERQLFTDPVTEQFPEIAEEYLGCIACPMDIRTINERLERYEAISELQDDLILMFKNCCIYNGEKTDLWSYSVKIWKQLNDIFKKACKEEKITVPRRF